MKKARATVEQTFGTFKSRYHVFRADLRLKVKMIPVVVLALAVLHNLAIEWGDMQLMYDTKDPEQQPDEVKIGATGNETRRNMVEGCFGEFS